MSFMANDCRDASRIVPGLFSACGHTPHAGTVFHPAHAGRCPTMPTSRMMQHRTEPTEECSQPQSEVGGRVRLPRGGGLDLAGDLFQMDSQ